MFEFNQIVERILNRISDRFDKREGSIIYDTTAPTAAEINQIAIEIAIYKEQTYLMTCTGQNLDNRAKDYAIDRNPATKAIRIGEMIGTDDNPIDIPLGRRFSAPNISGGLNFILIENISPGKCLLECETPGTIGHEYYGPLLPLFVINNLGSATMIGTQKPGEDIETDDHLRQRVLDKIRQRPFAGNIAAYREFTNAIDGVGDTKVYPVWAGGGTVKLSIVDQLYMPVTDEFISDVQEKIDPLLYNQMGYGYAPIGHRVTVATPGLFAIDVEAEIMLRDGYEIPHIQENVEKAIDDYLFEVKKDWSKDEWIAVLRAQIISAIVSVEGIYNVTNLMLNSEYEDVILEQPAQAQQIPYRGEVVLKNA